jgi:hypothetical protein
MANWEDQIRANITKGEALGVPCSISFRYELYPIYKKKIRYRFYMFLINQHFINFRKALHKILDGLRVH